MPASEGPRRQGRDPGQASTEHPGLPRTRPLTLPNPLPAGLPVAQQEGAGAKDHHQHHDRPEEHRSWNTEVAHHSLPPRWRPPKSPLWE